MEEEEFEMVPIKEIKKNRLFKGETSRPEVKRKDNILSFSKNAMDYYLQYCRDHVSLKCINIILISFNLTVNQPKRGHSLSTFISEHFPGISILW